jgi:pimeloyl-ACP methyl ester carboxylesterase
MIIFLVGLIIFCTALPTVTYRGLIRPPRRTYASAVARGRPGDPGEISPADGGPLEFREWEFQSRGVTLKVWDVRGECDNGPCFVMTHGWGDSKVGALSRIAALRSVGSRFIAWDLRGHGESGGSSTLGAIEHDDLMQLITQIRTESPLVLMGWSMGAGISMEVAARHPIGVHAVVSEAPYRLAVTPARNMLKGMGLPAGLNLSTALCIIGMCSKRSFFGGDPQPFDRCFWSGALTCPLLVLHGDCDEISPIEDGRDIAGAAKRGTFVTMEGIGHDGMWTNSTSREIGLRSVRDMLPAP